MVASLIPRPLARSSCRSLLLFTFISGSFHRPSLALVAPRHQQIRMITEIPTINHVDADSLPSWMAAERTRYLTDVTEPKASGKCIVYWMQRDVRTVDNWALLYAQHLAKEATVPLFTMYCLQPPPDVPAASDDDSHESQLPPKIMESSPMTQRYGSFLLGGLEKVHNELEKLNVALHVVTPSTSSDVSSDVTSLLDQLQPQVVISDFSPIRIYRQWMESQTAPALQSRKIPFIQVDAHNVVPVWHASPKREVGARTLRPKLAKLSPSFLADEYPEFTGNQHVAVATKKSLTVPKFDKTAYRKHLAWDVSVTPVAWAKPGTENGLKKFDDFLSGGLKKFDQLRNNPNYREICSNLSPWLNHGHLSFATLAQKVKKLNKYANGTASYIEEGLVRRELSDNFLFYSPNDYDELTCAAGWAQETLQVHSSDEREWLFSLGELESSQTHDDLWNAAQMQLVQEGKLHGFLRMYWAKKILEWSESPNVALRTAQFFNDKYALDGCDPNGFIGVGWSIMGIHDMGWKEREIFGKIRYMNYAGCKRKFDVAQFVRSYPGAAENALKVAEIYGKPPETGKKPTAAKKPAAGKKKAPATGKKPAAAKKKASTTGKKRKSTA